MKVKHHAHGRLLSYVGTSENHDVAYQTVQQKNTLQKIIILTTSGFDDIVINRKVRKNTYTFSKSDYRC